MEIEENLDMKDQLTVECLDLHLESLLNLVCIFFS
jgi:hypothetical protein